MVAGFDLASAGDGTKVVSQGEAQVFGRLTSVAGGLLEPLGKKQVQKFDRRIAGCVATGECGANLEQGREKNWVGKALPRKEEGRLLEGWASLPTRSSCEICSTCGSSGRHMPTRRF